MGFHLFFIISDKDRREPHVVSTWEQSANDTQNDSVTWLTSNEKYAAVDENGLVQTKKAGAGKVVTIVAKNKKGIVKDKYIIKVENSFFEKLKDMLQL